MKVTGRCDLLHTSAFAPEKSKLVPLNITNIFYAGRVDLLICRFLFGKLWRLAKSAGPFPHLYKFLVETWCICRMSNENHHMDNSGNHRKLTVILIFRHTWQFLWVASDWNSSDRHALGMEEEMPSLNILFFRFPCEISVWFISQWTSFSKNIYSPCIRETFFWDRFARIPPS